MNNVKGMELNLHAINANCMLIVVHIDDIFSHLFFIELTMLQHGSRYEWDDNEDIKHNPSCMLILVVENLKKELNDSFAYLISIKI